MPSDLTRNDVIKALDWVDIHSKDVPRNQRVRKYAIVRNGREYPPKFVIRKAYGLIHGTDWENIFGGGTEANNFLIRRQLKIIDKSERPARVVALEAVAEDPTATFREGGVLEQYRRHLRIERNRKVMQAAKNNRLRESGDLACEACNFSFQKTYGEVGAGFIEAHHKTPLGKLRGERNTRVSDIALLCANCHRIVHLSNPLLTVGELRMILEPQSKNEPH